jgi:peptidoglycan/LPS O-acetylase OafA/YrhL
LANCLRLNKLLLAFTKLAPISYSLYLLHAPVLSIVSDLGLSQYPLWKAAASAAILVPLCYLLEVRMQPVINRLTDRVFLGKNIPVAAN